ncbi:MAG: hypothetical protein EU539_09800 [Promethearchaeota archaeon]|nr:MAG: hypothetical protein EU539_09800 [Candidatus Lokiarchaeota archaeon]
MKKRYSNEELIYYRYFYHKTGIEPEHVILVKNFIFFFVNNTEYFRVKQHLNLVRKMFYQKIMLIRAETTLMRLLFSFFPDPYIHDVRVEYNIYSRKKIIDICFLSFEERGIAIGRNGDYIKAVNEIFEKHLIFEESNVPIHIKCSLISI